MGAASKTGSCFCASLSLPWPVRRPVVALGRFLTLDLVVRCLSTGGAVIEFWCLGTRCWSPVPSTLRQLENLSIFLGFRGYGYGFPPPIAGRSFIGGTSACSGSLLRLTAVSLAYELGVAVFCGGGFPHRYWWLPVFPSFRCGGRLRLIYPCCFVHRLVFRSILAYSRLSFMGVFGGLVQVFSCLALSVPVGVRSGFAPADFSSLWVCLVVRIKRSYFLQGCVSARVSTRALA